MKKIIRDTLKVKSVLKLLKDTSTGGSSAKAENIGWPRKAWNNIT